MLAIAFDDVIVIGYHCLFAFAQRRHGWLRFSWSQRTFRPLQESQARGRLKSASDLPSPGVGWVLQCVSAGM
jgi:hypothetical protein